MKYIAFLILFFAQTQFVSHAQNADIKLLRYINLNRQESLDPTFRLITNTVYPLAIATPLTFIIAGKITNNQAMFRNGLTIGASVIINEGMTAVLKYSINRKRPFVTYSDIIPQSYDTDPSFPSGHTSNAFSTATSLSLSYPKWYVIVPSFTWATAVGYSRLHLGMHYPSDVLGGAIVGTGSAYLTYKIRKCIEKRYSQRKPTDQSIDR